jgi:aromatic-L-amino-acid/L-tryptophan decarboxylase
VSCRSDIPLDLDGKTFRQLLEETSAFLVDFLDRLPRAPVYRNECDVLQSSSCRSGPPEEGRPLRDLLGVLARASETGVSNASGGFMAFVPNGGLPATALADLVSEILNRYTGVNFGALGLVALELEVLDWLKEITGFPRTAGGLLSSGGSLATVSALACVRESKAGDELHRTVIYVTDQTHHSLAKAARLVGFPRTSVRHVAVDEARRMDVAALEHAIRRDRVAGLIPICVASTAGTTNTGAIDPLIALAEIAAREGMWFHVDAAYGGFFRLTDRGRASMTGVERADSVVLDPHKGLFLPFGTGCLLVRDGDVLRRAHAEDPADYVRDIPTDTVPNFSQSGPELTRPFRGLRLWLPLHLHGVAAFRKALDAKLDLARYVYDTLASMPGIEVQAPPALSIVTFRIRAGGSEQVDDVATDALVRSINGEGRVMLSTTRVAGRTLARVAILGLRTRPEHVDAMLAAIREHFTVVGTVVPAFKPGASWVEVLEP